MTLTHYIGGKISGTTADFDLPLSTNYPNLNKKATIKRIKEESVVLLPQDTSTLNYTNTPSIKYLESDSLGIIPVAAKIPRAMGRSNPVPSFLISAGARLTVILSSGNR